MKEKKTKKQILYITKWLSCNCFSILTTINIYLDQQSDLSLFGHLLVSCFRFNREHLSSAVSQLFCNQYSTLFSREIHRPTSLPLISESASESVFHKALCEQKIGNKGAPAWCEGHTQDRKVQRPHSLSNSQSEIIFRCSYNENKRTHPQRLSMSTVTVWW